MVFIEAIYIFTGIVGSLFWTNETSFGMKYSTILVAFLLLLAVGQII